MLKKLLLWTISAALLGGLVLLFFFYEPKENSGLKTADPAPSHKNAESSPDKEEQTLDLALKSVNLSQGEGGFEIWRLKAEWANVRKQGEAVIVEQPRLIYFMDEGGKTLHVSSSTGDINQKSQILRFINNVRIIQEDKVVTGDLLVYNGSRKTMTFPDGGDFTSPGITGHAAQVEWDLNSKLITANGDVSVLFSQDERPTDNASAPTVEPQTAPPVKVLPRNPRSSSFHGNTTSSQLPLRAVP